MLSWLARLNFGVKIAKLTPFGGLGGTKQTLGGPLESPRRLQELNKGTSIIDNAAVPLCCRGPGVPQSILAS